MNLVVWLFWFEEKVYFTSFEGTYQIEIFQEISHTKPTQGQKNLSFELQSAPNLHRDKKAKVLNFKVHQTCTGTKKQKFWTSKCTKPAQGQKSKKSIYLGRVDYPSKVFVFLFFLSLCRFGALWSSKLLFFGPCAGFWHGGGLQSAPNLHRDKKTKVLNFKVRQTCTGTKKQKTKINQSTGEESTIRLKFLFFLSVCRFGAFWSLQCLFFCPCAGFVHFQVQNPMHCYMCTATLFPLFASYCASTCIFGFPCSFLEGQVHFSCKGLTIWR